MDFTDAVALVFAWFDDKVRKKDVDFINAERFPSRSAFVAYIRHAIWNAARLSERQQARRGSIELSSLDDSVLTQLQNSEVASPSPEEHLILAELVDELEEPHRTIIREIVFSRTPLFELSEILRLSVRRLGKALDEAIDILMSRMKIRRGGSSKKQHRRGGAREDRSNVEAELLLEFVNTLTDPDKSIFQRICMDGPDNVADDYVTLAGCFDLTYEQLESRVCTLIDRWQAFREQRAV